MSAMSTIGSVELVYLDDCPHWREADLRIREAMRRAGMDPNRVRYRGVMTADAPLDFPGSPTILLDGCDAFPAPLPAGPTCRRYRTEEGMEGAPSLEQLVDVLTRSSELGPGPMTVAEQPGASFEPVRRAFADEAAIGAVRGHGFSALFEGRALTRAELTKATSLPAARIASAIDQLRVAGALELDPGGRIVGAHGLTLRRTPHAIVTAERTWNTWCALDAIGIPAALRLDAIVHTSCAACGVGIQVIVRDGFPQSDHDLVLWQPGGPCAHVMDDFCAAANLFCNSNHLTRWRARAGEPPGQPRTIREAAEEGRRSWNDVTPASVSGR